LSLESLHLNGIHTLVDNSSIWSNTLLTKWQRGCVDGEDAKGCLEKFIAGTDRFHMKGNSSDASSLTSFSCSSTWIFYKNSNTFKTILSSSASSIFTLDL
jgi:hypothetical protein